MRSIHFVKNVNKMKQDVLEISIKHVVIVILFYLVINVITVVVVI